MKTLSQFASSLGALLAFGTNALAADALPEPLVIDDFSTGPLHQAIANMPTAWDVSHQPAPQVLGGVRQTSVTADDRLGAASRIDIDDRRLQVSTGIGSYFGATLGYGYDAAGGDGGLVAPLADYDYFQIDFERSDVGLEYLVEVIDSQGALALHAGVLTTEAQSGPHSVQLDFDSFQGADAQGNPQDMVWDEIRYVIVLFQSASASGGNDFSVTEISVRADPDEAEQ